MKNLQELAPVTISYLLGEDAKEAQATYKVNGTRGKLLTNYQAPTGLRELSSDSALIDALNDQ
ncbi:hypothetical protein Tel_00070 [Candidatus Tenderia electrophaga]|jgi:hypothetical protein|uniref:Uncharacterized protein n=1 Tax=Candidatus Tenderia electrophaga TaxID=1748243 RepID=A0A0S2T945_9GAMM|nr:hypothetical protein Tel_00070 [Candidatus Tenderia electrophaga]